MKEVDWNTVQSLFSETAVSCIYTNHITAKNVPWRKFPDQPGIPNEQMRLMLAQHIFEEAQETIEALGCEIGFGLEIELQCGPKADLEKIIDGACDTIYVATNVLMACGVPDLPHMAEICRANNAKFPNGVAITDATGKYRKPNGWKPPDHITLVDHQSHTVNLNDIGEELVKLHTRTFVSNTPPEIPDPEKPILPVKPTPGKRTK